MPTNLAQFNARLSAETRGFAPKLVRDAHRKVHLEALSRIVQRTPVDTGRARGNWQSSIGQPSQDVPYEPPAAAKRIVMRDGKRTHAGDGGQGAQRSIDQGVGVAGAIPPFSVSFITNNLPYIEPLENGSSKQAALGMVAVTVAELGGVA